MSLRHIVSATQFDRDSLEAEFHNADRIAELHKSKEGLRGLVFRHPEKVVFVFFYEVSTMTIISACTAALRQGMKVVQVQDAAKFSSARKGEVFKDSIRTICQYRPTIIAIRHPVSGTALCAAEIAEKYGCSVVNMGDGDNEHPTQALGDAYTIYKHFGKIDGLTIAIGGNLRRARVARSLAFLLALYPKVRIIFVSEPHLRVKDDIKEYLQEKKRYFREESDMSIALKEADIAYWMRSQEERGNDLMEDSETEGQQFLPGIPRGGEEPLYSLNSEMANMMKVGAIIMHSLPRWLELPEDVDSNHRAVYFEKQVNACYLMRCAVFDSLAKVREYPE